MPCDGIREAVTTMRASPLPDGLGPGPFSTAQARVFGVAPSRLRRLDLVHPTHGAHALVSADSLVQRLAAFQVAMPDGRAFSHLTAAVLWGIPLPFTIEQGAGPLDAMVDVIARTDDGMSTRDAVRGHRGLELRAVATPPGTGLTVVDLADTWCDLGELPRGSLSLTDLVVAGDAVVAQLDARFSKPVGRTILERTLKGRVRPRGAVVLRQALTLIRHRVRSPMESRARLMFVFAGFPEPEVNAPLTDLQGGWLAEGDLVWRAQRVVGEYQGRDHADPTQASIDSFRRQLLEDNRWRVKDLWSEDTRQGARRRTTLLSFANALELDPASLILG